MATPTSYPRPSPQKSHLTPAAASSPPPPPTPHSQASKKPLHYRNGSLHHQQPGASPSPATGGITMSRTGTANGGTPMARSGTNTSSVGKTPVPMRAGRGMSASSTATDSPGLTAAANMLMQGGTGMTPQGGTGMTPLGMGGVVTGLAGLTAAEQEEERRRRVEVIVQMVGERSLKYVGQEGVERCAKRAGLECLWEEGMGIGEKRVLSIAGSGLLVEVDFKGDEVVEVGLSFPASKEGEDGVGRWAKRGAEILKRDLRGGNMEEGYVPLKKFAANLDKLAKMDQLGGEEVSCFDAVDGIFKSLERIHDWELDSAKKMDPEEAHEEVARSPCGRPQMHVQDRVGLALQYWQDQRRVEGKDTPSDAMDVDNGDSDTEEESGKTWSIMIECDACSAHLYSPIKISDQWVSKDVEKPATQDLDSEHISSTNIDWLSIPDSSDAKSPDVRFVARFKPPVVLPLQLAMQIHASVGWPIDQGTVLPVTYEALLFAGIDARIALLTPRTTEHSPTLGVSTKPYRFTLFNQTQDFAQAVTEIPFKHPMEIVNLLATLRQWALFGTILRRSFTPRAPEESAASSKANGASTNGHAAETPAFQTLEEELADFLSSPSPNDASSPNGTSDDALAVEVTFITSPLPHFTVRFQNPKYGGKLASVSFSIGLNGTFEGVEVDDGRPPPNAGDAEAGSAVVQLREKTRRVLEIGESIGVLVEWLSKA